MCEARRRGADDEWVRQAADAQRVLAVLRREHGGRGRVAEVVDGEPVLAREPAPRGARCELCFRLAERRQDERTLLDDGRVCVVDGPDKEPVGDEAGGRLGFPRRLEAQLDEALAVREQGERRRFDLGPALGLSEDGEGELVDDATTVANADRGRCLAAGIDGEFLGQGRVAFAQRRRHHGTHPG